jgi:hypothetical protein
MVIGFGHETSVVSEVEGGGQVGRAKAAGHVDVRAKVVRYRRAIPHHSTPQRDSRPEEIDPWISWGCGFESPDGGVSAIQPCRDG